MNKTMQTHEVGSTLVPLNTGSEVLYTYKCLKNSKFY